MRDAPDNKAVAGGHAPCTCRHCKAERLGLVGPFTPAEFAQITTIIEPSRDPLAPAQVKAGARFDKELAEVTTVLDAALDRYAAAQLRLETAVLAGRKLGTVPAAFTTDYREIVDPAHRAALVAGEAEKDDARDAFDEAAAALVAARRKFARVERARQAAVRCAADDRGPLRAIRDRVTAKLAG